MSDTYFMVTNAVNKLLARRELTYFMNAPSCLPNGGNLIVLAGLPENTYFCRVIEKNSLWNLK